MFYKYDTADANDNDASKEEAALQHDNEYHSGPCHNPDDRCTYPVHAVCVCGSQFHPEYVTGSIYGDYIKDSPAG